MKATIEGRPRPSRCGWFLDQVWCQLDARHKGLHFGTWGDRMVRWTDEQGRNIWQEGSYDEET